MNTPHIVQTEQALLHIPILVLDIRYMFKVVMYPCRQRDNVERRLLFAVRKSVLLAACWMMALALTYSHL